jgi:hypothetical protein
LPVYDFSSLVWKIICRGGGVTEPLFGLDCFVWDV